MNRKYLAAMFIGAIMVSSACVNVTVDDNNNGSSGNNGGGGTGASGVTSTKKATDFTPQEKETFCEWLVGESQSKIGEYDCSNGETVTIEAYTVGQCEAELANNPSCPASSLEGCFQVLLDNPCALTEALPAACAALEQCAESTNNGGSNNGTSTEYCYDHNCNGDATGEQCFTSFDDYCSSLCSETNCISVEACEAECL